MKEAAEKVMFQRADDVDDLMEQDVYFRLQYRVFAHVSPDHRVRSNWEELMKREIEHAIS